MQETSLVQAGRVKSGHLSRQLSNLREFQKVVPKLQANARIVGLLAKNMLHHPKLLILAYRR